LNKSETRSVLLDMCLGGTFMSNLLRNSFIKKIEKLYAASLKGADFCYRWSSLCQLV